MVKHARQSRPALYGCAIIVILGVLAGSIFFLDSIRARFDRRFAVVVLMSRAPPGLGVGSPVWISGREVGTVTAIGFLPSPDTVANVIVTVDLPRSARAQVRADARVRLASARMIGEPALDLLAGSATAPMLAPGDTLRVERRLSVAELSREAALVRAQLDTTRVALQRLAPQLRARARQTRRTVAALDAAMSEARVLARSVSASRALSLFDNPTFAASLQHSRATTAELIRLLAHWHAHTASGGELRTAVERLQLHAGSLRAQLDATATALQTGDGTLPRAQRDSALFRAVEAARVALDSLVAETKRNPLRFVF